jgi:hypothetical protein
VSAEAIARKWHNQLLSSEPIDHRRAEDAVQAVYRATGLAKPQHFLWCSSPLQAAWSALVLIGKDKDYNLAVYEDIERLKTGKDKLAKARALVAERLDIEANDVEGYFGKAFYVSSGTNPITKQLTAGVTETWLARAQAGDDFLAPHAGGPFKPLHDLEQALHFEGYRGGAGSLYKEALAREGGKQIAILGGRSAQHRLYGNCAYVEVAIDEALAEAGKFEPTELQQALWAAYEACGLWWPCDRGVVFAERPLAGELATDGPRMEWADGFTVGGKPASKAAPTNAEPAAVPATKLDLLSVELPRNHSERIAYLRAQAPQLALLDRYLVGDHEQVWTDLVGLGPGALESEHAADAIAVAYETMHRVELNVATLARRLKAMDYRFLYPGSDGGLFGLGKAKAHEPHLPPPSDVRAKIAELESLAGGPIPLSLRAFFEVVGEVNFNGDHPALAPKGSDLTSDPLMVCSVEDAIAMADSYERPDDELAVIEFAPDALHKANISGGAPYSIEVPNPAADAPVEDEPHGVSFVAYLRLAILGWGGFPGWEQTELAPPPEIERLRDQLVRF